MSATTFALRQIADSRRPLGRHERLVLLALAALADERLDAPCGLDVIPAPVVAAVTGLATSTTTATLRALSATGLVVTVAHFAAVRHAYIGETRLPRGAQIRGFRPTEEALNS